jgi:hypothetical protein
MQAGLASWTTLVNSPGPMAVFTIASCFIVLVLTVLDRRCLRTYVDVAEPAVSYQQQYWTYGTGTAHTFNGHTDHRPKGVCPSKSSGLPLSAK